MLSPTPLRRVADLTALPIGRTVWLTGLSGAGKSTTAEWLSSELRRRGMTILELDGDVLRDGISAELGFDDESRAEAVRRAGEIALLAAQQGITCIVSLVSPHREPRDSVRARHLELDVPYFEVHIATPLTICEERDPKHLYAKARHNSGAQMTGIQQPYEEPLDPELRVSTHNKAVAEVGQLILEVILRTG